MNKTPKNNSANRTKARSLRMRAWILEWATLNQKFKAPELIKANPEMFTNTGNVSSFLNNLMLSLAEDRHEMKLVKTGNGNATEWMFTLRRKPNPATI